MKHLKLFENKEIININNGEVLKIDDDIFNKLSTKKIIRWNKEIGYHVYDDEFSSLIKDYIEKYKKSETEEKPVNIKRKFKWQPSSFDSIKEGDSVKIKKNKKDFYGKVSTIQLNNITIKDKNNVESKYYIGDFIYKKVYTDNNPLSSLLLKDKEIKKVRLGDQEILIDHYYTCKKSYGTFQVEGIAHYKFTKGRKYKVIDVLHHEENTKNYVYIRYYKDDNYWIPKNHVKKPTNLKMNILSFSKHFEK